MARARLKRRIARHARSDEFAIVDQQVMAAKDPCSSMRALLDVQTDAFAGRPYSLWRDDPEIARALNEGLLPRED